MGEQDAILVIDHDPDAALLLSDFLEREGYAVAVARTGAEGLRLIRRGTFALVLLDLDLPDLEGASIMREAGQVEAPPEVIVVTGRATVDSAIQAVESRSAGYILKPVDLSRLGSIVARVFDRRRLAQDNARLHAELAERLAESEALAAISATVSSTLDVREALRRICRELVRFLGADTAAAYLQDLASGRLVPTAAYHVPREHLDTLSSTPLPLTEQGSFLSLWQERRPVFSDDVSRDARFTHGMFQSFPHQSGLLLPLIVEDEVIGGFYVVWWTARRGFSERELRGLDRVCEQVGFFLRNARLYEQAERNQHRLEVLNDVSRRLAAVHDPEEVLTVIVNEAARLVGAEAAGLRLLEGGDLVVGARTEGAAGVMARPRLKVGESLSGLVVAAGEPLVVEDLAEDTRYDPAHKRGALERGFRGFIGVPLRAHGRAVGTLNVFTTGARHFLPDEVALLSALADQASLAIEKARLLRETEEGRALLERLSHAAVLMQSSWERDDRLAAFVRAARDVVGFDRVNVFLLTADGSELEPVTTGDDDEPRLRLPVTAAAGPYHEALTSRRPVAVLSDADLARVLPLDRAHLDRPYLRSRRFVIAPLVVGDRVIGVVSADNKTSRRPISPGSVEPFSSLCQNLAMALEESLLYAEARAREEEMRRREGEAKTLSDGLALLNQAARALHRTLEVDAMLDGALKELAKAYGASGALLHLLADDGTLSRSVGHWVSTGPRPGDPSRLGGLSDHVRRTRAPLLLRDVTKHPDFVHPANLAHGVRSIAAYPIVGQNERVLGVLVLYYPTSQAFGEIETRLLSSYADQLATALENAGLYEETQTQRVRLAQIFDSTSDGIVLVSRDGEIQAANRQAGELLGFDPSSVIGVRLSQLATGRRSSMPDSDRVFEHLGAILQKPDLGDEGDLELKRSGRTVHWAGRPIKDTAGTTIGFTLTLRDVTHERQVSQMKTDFVSFVTHQLRTPLAGIKWMLELASQTSEISSAEAGGYVEDARTAAERLIGLVNDLLDISRLESGKLTVALQPTSLGNLTQSSIDDLGALIRDKGLRLSVAGAEGAPMVMADPQLLRQAIMNLTSNALKYTPSGGDISIRIDRENGRTARWTITDSGIGIPKTALGRLFEKFYRADNVHTVETEGTGLGLYLVRLIIERLAGEVWCESEEGRGSAFIFTLPISE